MAAQRAGFVFRLRHRRRSDQYLSPLCHDSRHSRRLEDAEGFESAVRRAGSRPAGHREDFRGLRKILRAPGRAGRQAGAGRQVARRHQKRGQDAGVRELGKSGKISRQRGSRVQNGGGQIADREARMKKLLLLLMTVALLSPGSRAAAQDLGLGFKKVSEGIYVYAAVLNEANSTIILTQDGVVLIDTGQSPKDSHVVMAAVKKLTSQPVRFVIHTEPHPDHAMGDFVFSPPAVVIGHAGSAASMKASDSFKPERIEKQTASSPEMREAFKGFRLVTPQIEYRDKMSLNLGERAFELYYLKNVHSEADSVIWLPKERVLFTAASVGVKRFGNHRPLVSIPDTLSAIKMMKALNPQVVIPGHGNPGTAKILDDMESYYDKLMNGVRQMVKEGKSLEQIKKELKIPGTEDWEGQDRLGNNIEAAYRGVMTK